MSLYNDASLVMIPSAYKDGKLYSIKPTDGSGDFTFSRGSNLAATRVDENGLIEKGRENLLLQSNQFDTSWVKSNATLTSGQTGYDGSSDAWSIEANADGLTRVLQSPSISANTPVTISIYAKSGNVDFIKFNLATSGTNSIATFDITDGSVYNSNAIDENWQSIGNGWVRISATFVNSIAITQVRFEVRNTANTSALAGDFIYIQDAQLEYGLVATDYIETTTTTAQAGILEDMPRLDYSGSCPSLLLEPQRTNLIEQSEYFNSWSNTSASVTSNAATSPEGVQNASKLVEASGSSFHFIASTPTIASGSVTFSFYAKSAERTSVSAFLTQAGNNGANFDLSAETATAQGTGNTASIESVGDGWYRCVVTNSGSAQVASQVRIGVQNGALDSYVGDGTSGVYIYGAQVEQASYPTSYIPCYGAATSRSSENMLDLTLNYGNTFSALFDLSGLGGSASNNFIIRLGSTNSIYLSVRKSDKKLQFYSPASPTGYFATTATQKIAISCDGTNWIWSSDGASGTLTATGSNNAEYIKIRTDGGAGGGLPSALVNQIALFDTALTADELNSLTS